MIAADNAITTDQYIASNPSFLYQDNSLESPKQDKDTSVLTDYGYAVGSEHEDASNEALEQIQEGIFWDTLQLQMSKWLHDESPWDFNIVFLTFPKVPESPAAAEDLEHPDENIFIRALFEGGTQVGVQDETKEIIDWYAEQVSQILEAKALLYKQDGNNIEFVVVVDHIRRDHSFQLSDLACELDDLYPHWEFDFQYISIRTAGQLPLDEYSDISNGG